MASRQAFLKRELRKPAGRPEQRKTAPRRKPGRPQVARPRRKPGPLWRPVPKPVKPFGTPPTPRPALPRPAFPRVSPLTRRALRRLPGLLGAAFFAWDVYEAYQWWHRVEPEKLMPEEYDGSGICKTDSPRPNTFGWSGSGCLSFQPYPNAAWGPSWQWLHLLDQRPTPYTGRWDSVQRWHFPHAPSVTPYIQPPIDMPAPMPLELPYPYPNAPMPYPEAPPLSRPDARPAPDPAPQAYSPPLSMPGRTPAIELGPNGRFSTGTHFQRPPGRNERERKKRLTGVQARAWLKLMEATGGSLMEKDDVIAAMYKGLPWKLRRWKGRDGVWRDRDATTTTRLSRLFSNLGSLDVGTALSEVAKNELGDAIYGRLGKALKDRTQQLADQGLWSGSRGVGQGTPLENSWDETYKRLKAEAAARDPARWYRTKEFDAENGQWVRRWRQRPVMSVPWYRFRSLYDRRLTNYANPRIPKGRPRYYYGPNSKPAK